MDDLQRMRQGLQYLLELDGEIFPMENGFWTLIEARLVTPNASIPHGLRYSLTLHDRTNRRVLGYDNAHQIRTGSRGYLTTRKRWDHKHHRSRIEPYDFINVHQLLHDFCRDASRIVDEYARNLS